MNEYVPLIFATLIALMGARTLCWHLQCWQLREYRFDRMRAWINTHDGYQYFVPWVFKGLLPRPKFSGRILIILSLVFLFSLLVLVLWFFLWDFPCSIRAYFFPELPQCHYSLGNILLVLIWERTLWLQVLIGVWGSKLPAWFGRQRLFAQAQKIIHDHPANIVRIGITGSYGKSSTKEILVHLLQSEFGKKAVLYNPANENNEVAIARLIVRHKKFFQAKTPKYFVFETGAYRRGEIAETCRFAQPHMGILTGVNQQHIELFGSQKNIQMGKFELAEATAHSVFFNADSPLLKEIFDDRDIHATRIPISAKVAKDIKPTPEKTTFKVYGKNFILPWPGAFFVSNALLTLECARELGISPANLAKHLKTLPALRRALTLDIHKKGFSVMRDTYSANADGVLKALDHVSQFKGQKIMVSIPLRELGNEATSVHEQIFKKCKKDRIKVFWCKTDFADLGTQILGSDFHLINKNTKPLQTALKKCKDKNDVVLLESKLPAKVLRLF